MMLLVGVEGEAADDVDGDDDDDDDDEEADMVG